MKKLFYEFWLRSRRAVQLDASRPLVLAMGVFTVAVVAFFIFSFEYHWFDPLVPGTWHGRLGQDYFSLPRGFLNLLSGHGILNTDASSYGPYAVWYPYHPVLAVVLGSWLSLFSPIFSFSLAVVLSLGLLVGSAWLIGTLADRPVLRMLPYPLLLVAPATYAMLWNAQMHVLVVAAVSMILVALVRMVVQVEAKSVQKQTRWLLGVGMLLSLFSKPLVLLFLPVLLLLQQTRKPALISLAIYTIVSAAFVFVPWLNPEAVPLATLVSPAMMTGNTYQPFAAYDNLVHWMNMAFQSEVTTPATATINRELFSLPVAWLDWFGMQPPGWVVKFPILLVWTFSLGVLFLKKGRAQVTYAFLVVVSCILAYYLSYSMVWEYHYTSLLPVVPVLLIALYRRVVWLPPVLVAIFFGAAAVLYMPVCHWLFLDSLAQALPYCRMMRVGPVITMFVVTCLAMSHVLLRSWKGSSRAVGSSNGDRMSSFTPQKKDQ